MHLSDKVNSNMDFKIVLVLFFTLNISFSSGDIFTSMSDVNTLVKTESEMIRTVENYIAAQEFKLEKLKRNLLEIEKVHQLTADSPEEFLGNPINSFLLIKRLTIDWMELQSVLKSDDIGQKLLTNLTNIFNLPNEEDLSGVAIALTRLQETYNLDTSELAKGKILGITRAYRELTANDCFELGRQSYNNGDFHHTMLWMTEALNRHQNEENPTTELFDIIEYLAFAAYKENHISKALQLTERMLLMKPDHKRALGNREFYLKEISEQDKKPVDSLEESVRKGYTVKEKDATLDTDNWQIERTNYERLCRGEAQLPASVVKKLTCFYQTGPASYLRIGPVKAEMVHIHPTVVIYHQVLYDSEIEIIKELAKPKFQRATVQNFKTGELETAAYRISKSAWLKEVESETVQTVNARIGAITGLNMDTAEELQVANYGIGGHYEPHYDFARREEKDAFVGLKTGNRIATFLFYMSDVTAGGATVFTQLELAVLPIKGAAAFWFNLMPNGEGDMRTRHAACPVLVGYKWVSNKWMHEIGQEFHRPCSLKQSDPANLIL